MSISIQSAIICTIISSVQYRYKIMVVIQSAKRALDILSLFNPTNPTLGVSDVAAALEINNATAARIMATMELSGFIKRTKENSRKYCLDKKAGDLARAYLSGIDLKEVARPHLEELHSKTTEMVVICIRKGDQRCFLDWIESSRPVRFVVEMKNPYAPLHAGAPGKAILAFLPTNEADDIIERTGLPGYTDITITKKKELKKELEQIRELGISVSRGEHTEHVSTIAAPVRNFSGNVIASLGISWLTIDGSEHDEKKYVGLLKKAAQEISMQMGYFENN